MQLTTRTTDFLVVSKMSVDLVGFVILVGVVYQDPKKDKTIEFPRFRIFESCFRFRDPAKLNPYSEAETDTKETSEIQSETETSPESRDSAF